MRSIFLFIALVLFYASNAQIDTALITAKLERSKAQLGKNIAFVLFKDGKVIYKKDSPDFNVRTQQDMNAGGQWLIAALIMTYVQEGKLSLDDKVSTFIPLFAKHGKAFITIRHCLSHNTGIEAGKLFQKGNFSTLEAEVNNYASNREIEFNPGTVFKYSNVGPRIAARVIETIAKRPFERLLTERVLRPLAMRATSFTNDNSNDAPDPSTGGKSTALDYANFLGMLLNKGTLNGKSVLTEASVNTLLTLHATADKEKNVPKEIEGADYALGAWIVESNAKGGTAFVAPSMDGMWPLVDLCRGYAFALFAKDADKGLTKDFYLEIKRTIDSSIPINCK